MFDPVRLVFIDETCARTRMVRLRGRSPRGEPLIGYVPHGHRKTITFVAGLRMRGMTASCVLVGAMNGPMFLAYVKNALLQHSSAATSSSCTIRQFIRSLASSRRLKKRVRHSSICRRIRPTSTPSS